MADNAAALALGVQHHRARQFQQAEQIYRQVLQEDPGNADALGHLADLCMMQGRFAEAVSYFQPLLGLKPHFAQAHNDLGVAFAQQGQLDVAVASLRRALACEPDFAGAHSNLGILLVQQGQVDEAIHHYSEAIRLRPNFFEAHNNLGIALASRGQAAAAIEHYREALRLRPNFEVAHNNLGLALAELGQLEEAVACYRQALEIQPRYADAYYNLGVVFARAKQFDDAIACYRYALAIKPEYAEVHNNLGVELMKQGQLEAALAHLRQALASKPNYPAAHYNLGLGLVKARRVEEAAASFQEAIRLQPDYAEAHKDLALAWLLLGKFGDGWREYEWRWHCAEIGLRPLPRPLWDGAPLAGQLVALHAEQGLGDTLQFVRYAPLVQERGGRVVVVCQPPLLSLLGSAPGVERVAPQGALVADAQLHVSLLSLPGLCATTLTTIPARVPYLAADPLQSERWRQEVHALCPDTPENPVRLRIGIAWQGNPKHKQDRQRSVPLARFERLAQVPGVRLLSLQVGPGTEQLQDPGRRTAVIDLGRHFDASSFQDVAAAMQNLDLVLSVDSALAHLAGALGLPVWTLLPYVPDWRWLLEREDSPWYPTMRLFRQRQPGDWEEVFERVAAALLEFSAGGRRLSK